jgi:hypothetical protein
MKFFWCEQKVRSFSNISFLYLTQFQHIATLQDPSTHLVTTSDKQILQTSSANLYTSSETQTVLMTWTLCPLTSALRSGMLNIFQYSIPLELSSVYQVIHLGLEACTVTIFSISKHIITHPLIISFIYIDPHTHSFTSHRSQSHMSHHTSHSLTSWPTSS